MESFELGNEGCARGMPYLLQLVVRPAMWMALQVVMSEVVLTRQVTSKAALSSGGNA
jgi:hypothetical protein